MPALVPVLIPATGAPGATQGRPPPTSNTTSPPFTSGPATNKLLLTLPPLCRAHTDAQAWQLQVLDTRVVLSPDAQDQAKADAAQYSAVAGSVYDDTWTLYRQGLVRGGHGQLLGKAGMLKAGKGRDGGLHRAVGGRAGRFFVNQPMRPPFCLASVLATLRTGASHVDALN